MDFKEEHRLIEVGRVARLLVALFVVVLCGSAHGQEASEEDLQAMKQANNPLASFTTLEFHNYYQPELDETDGAANTFRPPTQIKTPTAKTEHFPTRIERSETFSWTAGPV